MSFLIWALFILLAFSGMVAMVLAVALLWPDYER